MKIAVVGATGMVGWRIAAEATDRGHQVLAVARSRSRSVPGATAVSADARDASALRPLLDGRDAVVLAVRPDARGGPTAQVLSAAAAAGLPLLVVGGAGPLHVPGADRLAVDDPRYVPPAWREVAAASIAQLRVCERRPDGAWSYLAPPAVLRPGARTGTYRRGTTTLLIGADGDSQISVEDLAVAVVDELESPSDARRLTVGR